LWGVDRQVGTAAPHFGGLTLTLAVDPRRNIALPEHVLLNMCWYNRFQQSLYSGMHYLADQRSYCIESVGMWHSYRLQEGSEARLEWVLRNIPVQGDQENE
jgi:hypothetical protein